jgi:hypothetical protein
MIFDKIATVETAFGTYKTYGETGYRYLDRHQLVTYNDTLTAIYLPPDSTMPGQWYFDEHEPELFRLYLKRTKLVYPELIISHPRTLNELMYMRDRLLANSFKDMRTTKCKLPLIQLRKPHKLPY